MSHIDDDVPPQPVYQAAGPREQQQLGILADEDGRMACGEIAPEHVVGPLLIPGNELDLIGIAEVVVAERRSHKEIPRLVIDSAHQVFSQLRTISDQPPLILTSAACIASFTDPCVTIGSCFSEPM